MSNMIFRFCSITNMLKWVLSFRFFTSSAICAEAMERETAGRFVEEKEFRPAHKSGSQRDHSLSPPLSVPAVLRRNTSTV